MDSLDEIKVAIVSSLVKWRRGNEDTGWSSSGLLSSLASGFNYHRCYSHPEFKKALEELVEEGVLEVSGSPKEFYRLAKGI